MRLAGPLRGKAGDSMNEKKKKRIVQIAVILLIAAVVVTYSITFVGAIFY